jgi:hypothetical protein
MRKKFLSELDMAMLEDPDEIKKKLQKKLIEMESTMAQNSPTPQKHKRFTAEEDERLLEAVEKYGMDWNLIALDFGRTSSQVRTHYYNHAKPGLKRSLDVPFSEEEDAILIKSVSESTIKSKSKLFMEITTNVLPERGPIDLLKRWNELNPNLDHGPFSEMEEQTLKEALNEFGSNFKLIVENRFPKRTAVFLRRQWFDLMSRKNDYYTINWAPELDQKLIDAVDEHGYYAWKHIRSEYFPNLVDSAELLERYKNLWLRIPIRTSKIPKFDSVKDEMMIQLIRNHDISKITQRLIEKEAAALIHTPISLIKTRGARLERGLLNAWTPELDEKLKQFVEDQEKEHGFVYWPMTNSILNLDKRACLVRWNQLLNRIREDTSSLMP